MLSLSTAPSRSPNLTLQPTSVSSFFSLKEKKERQGKQTNKQKQLNQKYPIKGPHKNKVCFMLFCIDQLLLSIGPSLECS